MSEDRRPLAVCLGGGGAFGIGFNMGVALGLREAGIDVTRAPMLGTSAGAYAAAALAAGITFDDIAQHWTRFVEVVGRRPWVRTADLTDEIYGHATARGTSSVAVRLLNFRRTILSGETIGLSDLVAASSSPIPLARPHRVQGRRYVDGGLRRQASADLAPAADLQLLVSPFAHRAQGFMGRQGARQAKREIRRWTARSGGQVLHVIASDDVCALGARGMAAIGDMEVGRKVYELALPLGRSTAESMCRTYPSVVERLSA
jgi:NTE family protein